MSQALHQHYQNQHSFNTVADVFDDSHEPAFLSREHDFFLEYAVKDPAYPPKYNDSKTTPP